MTSTARTEVERVLNQAARRILDEQLAVQATSTHATSPAANPGSSNGSEKASPHVPV